MLFKNQKSSIVEFVAILAALAGVFWVASTLSKGRFSAGAGAYGTSAEETIRVSVNSGGEQGDGFSFESSISADGRYVAFTSHATNLVPGDSNGQDDVFVYDTQTHTTTRVSVDSNGAQANNDSSSFDPSISADGRYVAFVSESPDLVPGDTNASADIFVHDMQTGMTTRVSVDSNGAQAKWSDPSLNSISSFSNFPSISASGHYVVFSSSATNLIPGDANKTANIFVHDMQTGATTCASTDSNGVPGNRESYYASISADGRYVAFTSYATNLVPGDTNKMYDVFVHDMQTGKTTRISTSANGEQGNGQSTKPSVSADGRYVVFESDTTNLVPGDTNGATDVFVYEMQSGVITLVSVASNGTQGIGSSNNSSISADGNYIVFESNAFNLVAEDTNEGLDVFVHAKQTGITRRVSVNSSGEQAIVPLCFPCYSFPLSISANGQYVTFTSSAANLVPEDTNSGPDIFVHRLSVSPDAPATDVPTDLPTLMPTEVATMPPTDAPTSVATDLATDIPTDVPTDLPTDVPTDVPTFAATDPATDVPTDVPTFTGGL